MSRKLRHCPCCKFFAFTCFNHTQKNSSVYFPRWQCFCCCSLIASTPKGRLFPVLEEPRSQFTTTSRKKPAELVQDRISKADAVLLLTDKPVYEIPNNLQSVKEHCNGRVYLWCSYGVCCALLGGTVSNKQVAMQLRVLLEDSNNLLVGRVLPRPCNFEKMYSVDPMCETGEPCVT